MAGQNVRNAVQYIEDNPISFYQIIQAVGIKNISVDYKTGNIRIKNTKPDLDKWIELHQGDFIAKNKDGTFEVIASTEEITDNVKMSE